MTNFHTLLANLRRPRLLIRAARFGLEDYRRDKDLRRLLPHLTPERPEQIMTRLVTEEEGLEASRKDGDISYSLARHVEVLIALMGEVRLLPRDQHPINPEV
jgi:hypothetical protein